MSAGLIQLGEPDCVVGGETAVSCTFLSGGAGCGGGGEMGVSLTTFPAGREIAGTGVGGSTIVLSKSGTNSTDVASSTSAMGGIEVAACDKLLIGGGVSTDVGAVPGASESG